MVIAGYGKGGASVGDQRLQGLHAQHEVFAHTGFYTRKIKQYQRPPLRRVRVFLCAFAQIRRN